MSEKSRRNTEKSRREAEMCRAAGIQHEMAQAVRLIGGDGSAKEQNSRAARATGLSLPTIERLRWRKLKRVPADIADAVREAVETHTEKGLSRARHEAFLAQQQIAILRERLAAVDPDFYGPDIDRLGNAHNNLGRVADRTGGEG